MNSRIDIYLNRIGQVSQLLLVGFAIFGYFYTVRPIYQNASLQESIAKKEIELKGLQSKIDELYINLRSELIRKFVTRVTYDCSPGMPLLMQAPSNEAGDQEPFIVRFKEYKALISDNPYNCLRKKAEEDTELLNLRDIDRKKMTDSIKLLKPIITDRYNEMLKKTKDNQFLENVGKNSGEDTTMLDEFLVSNGIKLPDDKYYKQYYILSGMESVILNFSRDFNQIVSDKIKF